MRTFAVSSFVFLFALTGSAANLEVAVSRNGFTGPIEIALAPRVEGRLPEWSVTKTLDAGRSAVTFPHLAEGLYIVLARGPRPLQRLSAKVNVGTAGSTLHLDIPKTATAVSVTLAGKPLPHAAVAFTHDELRWHTEIATDARGHFEGPLWEPGRYSANVIRDRASAPHLVKDVSLSPEPLRIDVPDRHVTGRVLGEDGQPIVGAQVILRSESAVSTLTSRARSGAGGRFTFFGVREGAQTLTARAPSRLDSDAVRFELRGVASHSADLVLVRGETRAVRLVDARGAGIAGATLFVSCEGHMKSQAVTDEEGRAHAAIPAGASCSVCALPKEGSIAIARFASPGDLLIRVPDGSSSLRLALRTETGEPFTDVRLLLRLDGMVLPPEVARLLLPRGFPLVTDEEGDVSLAHIPPGTYEFWPYRSLSEGQLIYEVSSEIAAPISLQVLAGQNNATVRFKAR